jgi:hypothetical protein
MKCSVSLLLCGKLRLIYTQGNAGNAGNQQAAQAGNRDGIDRQEGIDEELDTRKGIGAEKKHAVEARGGAAEAVGRRRGRGGAVNAYYHQTLPVYEPPLDLIFEASESLATGLSELKTFKTVFGARSTQRDQNPKRQGLY